MAADREIGDRLHRPWHHGNGDGRAVAYARPQGDRVEPRTGARPAIGGERRRARLPRRVRWRKRAMWCWSACSTPRQSNPWCSARMVSPGPPTPTRFSVFDHSTAMPLPTAEMAKRLAGQTGMRWVDAPLWGGEGFAREGKLTVMAGGERGAFDAVLPVMRDYAQNMTLMGPAGAGQMTKVINQGICGVTYVLMAEVLRLAEEGGIDAARIPDCLTGGHADSTLLHFAYPKMQTRRVRAAGKPRPADAQGPSQCRRRGGSPLARFAAGSHSRAALPETCRCGQRHARDLLDLRTLQSAEGLSAMRIERQSLHL